MKTDERSKYIKALKKELNSRIKRPYAVAQVHLSGDIVIIDIKFKYRNLLHNQRSSLEFHDCYALPPKLGYGVASCQADFIIGCYNNLVKSAYLVD